MKPFFRKRYVALLVLLLAAILAGLAFLQYRSTEQVSEATARDMEESLQSDLFGFRHSLERELTSLCFELEPTGNSTNIAREVTQRFTLWNQTTSHAGLVNQVLLWDQSGKNPSVLTKGGEFKPSPWPPQLSDMPAELAQSFPAANPGGPFHSDSPPPDPARAKFGWMIDQERLLLLHPVLKADESAAPHVIWLIIPLDRAFLSQHLLPELAGSHDRGGAYQVAVTFGQDPPKILYASQPTSAFDSKSPTDASLNLFGPPTLARKKASHLSGIVIPSANPTDDTPHLFIDPLIPSPPGPAFTITARYRPGSLEAAVSQLRIRNLTLNFAVLGILALTLVVILFTSHRAHTLGQMQMDFVAGVSHELRTPLTAITLAARNLEDGVVRPDALARYGTAIKGQAAQLAELVDEILLFSETQSGHHEYKIEPVDVALIIQTTLENLAPLIEASGFTIEQDTTADLPLVRADALALTQSLQNLISNSLKYGGDNKWVGIHAFPLINKGMKEVHISVTDRGIGIAAAELPQIFEPFYRSPEVSSQIHGNGLGLALTKSMVQAMNGRLTVSSIPAKGSTFTIQLRTA